MKREVTRRTFISLGTTAAVGAALAACAPRGTPAPDPEAPQVEEAVVEQPEPAQETVEITIAKGENPAQPNLKDAPAHLENTRHTGVRLNINIVPTDYEAKRNVWLASDTVPDLMHATPDGIRDFVPHGVMQSLTPLIDQHAPNIKRYLDAQPDIKRSLFDGQVYFVPGIYYNRKGDLNMPCIRMDVLEETGLEAPSTFEELLEVVKEMKKASPNSLGWTQRIFGASASHRLFTNTAFSFGSGYPMYYDYDEEKWLYGPLYPEFKELLDYFTRAYSEGVLDPDYAISTPDMWHEKNSSGPGLFSYENMTFAVRWNGALRQIMPDGTWGVLPTLSGLKGVRKTSARYALGSGYAMGRQNKHPERTIQMLDWMVTPFGLDTTNWGIEGTHYVQVTPRPERIDDYTVDGIERALPPSSKELAPGLFEEYAQRTDSYRTYQSETGTGLLDFVAMTDSAVEYLWDPPGEVDEWYATSRADPGQVRAVPNPPFPPELVERVKNITTDIEAILVPSYERVILGRESMADYEKSVERAVAAGAHELEDLFNEAEAAL